MTPEMEKTLNEVSRLWQEFAQVCFQATRADWKGEGWPTDTASLGACIGKNIACFGDAEVRHSIFWSIAMELATWEANFRGVAPPVWDQHNIPHAVGQYLMSHWVNAITMLEDPRCRQEEIDFLMHALEEGVRIRTEEAAARRKMN